MEYKEASAVEPIDSSNKIGSLAAEAVRLARNTLIIHLRFMDSAISHLRCSPVPNGTISVNGEQIFYEPVHILRLYAGGAGQLPHAYLHMVFHCIFRHFFVSPRIRQDLWNAACDMAVENVILELGLPALDTARDARQRDVLKQLSPKSGGLTAEKIYRYLRESAIDDDQLLDLARLFYTDDHSLWYSESSGENSGDDTDGREDSDNEDDPDDRNAPGDSRTDDRKTDMPASGMSRDQLEQLWKDVSERMQTDLETFSREKGKNAGHLMQNLAAVNRDKVDYEAFLKKFAVPVEAMKLNPDEFDHIYYCYGLNLFPDRRMPLIEPLEYRDVKQIREFVIAIDTSGSVRGELVQEFMRRTYSILKSTESFASKICLHIIQCDTEIQEDAKITSQDEFDEYMKHVSFKGFGGTDFRPVFEYVNEMIAEHEFTDLKGLIYFTDGYGEFPKKKPQYQAAFVFVDDDHNKPDVPPWAIRLVLSRDEIREETHEH